MDEFEVYSDAVAPGMTQREAFIFVSSPKAVTPYHLDLEYNFLLQIHGTKTFHVFDRTCVTEEELEKRFSGGNRNLCYKEEYQPRAS
jgi:hypothetical protein